MHVAVTLFGLSFASSTVELKVLDEGTEPRVSLGVDPPVGTVEQVSYDVNFTADVTTEGVSLPSATMPSLQLTVRSEVKAAEDGGFRAAISVPAVGVSPGSDTLSAEVREAAEQAMVPMTKLQGMVSIDRFGAPSGAEWSTTDASTVSPELIGEVERAVELLQVRRPERPVGQGARWTVTRRGTDAMGFAITDVETWTVASLTPEAWTLEMTNLQQAEVPQDIAGSTLKSHTGAAQGRAVLDPTHLLPSRVELGLTLRTRMLLEGAVNSTTTSTLEAKAIRRED